MFQEIVNRTNAALRRLSRPESEADAAAAELELRETHIPTLECEDPVLAAATRDAVRWMLSERGASAAAAGRSSRAGRSGSGSAGRAR